MFLKTSATNPQLDITLTESFHTIDNFVLSDALVSFDVLVYPSEAAYRNPNVKPFMLKRFTLQPTDAAFASFQDTALELVGNSPRKAAIAYLKTLVDYASATEEPAKLTP